MDIISERWRWFAKGRRPVLAIVSAVALLAGLATISFTTASALTRQAIFELDGNTVDPDTTSAPWDWTKFFDAAGDRKLPLPQNFVDSGFDADSEFPDTSTFTSGSKDTLNIGTGWSCTDSNNLGGKFDIINAYSTIYQVPATADGFTQGDQLLFFGIERAATEGTGNMGFWFLKDGTVDCAKTGGGKAPSFTGNHVDGDIFVVAGFTNGGTNATVSAYKWNGGADGSLSTTPFVDANEVCTQTDGTGSKDACGIVNTATIATGTDKPWPSPDKNGGDLDVNAFYEGFVRVPAAQVSGCFATFVANTRSSTSTTATIMDFSRGSFPTCRPSTSLSASPTTAAPEVTVVGDTVTYTFRETNDGNTPLTNVYLTDDSAACTMSPASVATLAAGAYQDFTCSFASTAEGVTTVTAIGHGTSDVGEVTFCNDPATVANECTSTQIHDADEKATAKSVAITPGTEMTIGASPTTVKQGDTVTFTFTEKNDGTAPTGFTSYLDLTGVALSTDSTACNNTLTRTIPAGATDQTLSQNETWTYTCTVTAPADDFTVVATGTGTVLSGSSHARVVTYSTSPACVNSSGATGTPGKYCDSEERVGTTVTVISPSTSLDVTASAVITYTFSETNDSADAPLTPPTPSVRESVITATETIATVCNSSALAYVSGDTGGDKILGVGETWIFTCTGTLAGPAGTNVSGTSTKTATGIGHGTDGTTAAADVTYCGTDSTPATTAMGKVCDSNERDKVTVTITYQPRGANPA